jgi:fumarate reductase subunit C
MFLYLQMRLRAGYSAAILIFFGALYLLTKAFDLLNKPSDTAVFGGILIIVALIALVPSALHWIWHHHVTPHAYPVRMRKEEKDAN